MVYCPLSASLYYKRVLSECLHGLLALILLFCLLESQTRRYVDIEHAGFLHPLGLRHFYDGFSLRAEVSIRSSALAAFQLQEDEVHPDLDLSRAAVAVRGWGGHQEQPVDQNAPEADRRNVPDDVISVSDSEVDQLP